MKTFQQLTAELESQGYEWRFITEPTEESAEGWEYLAGVAWHNSSGCFCVGMFYRRPKPVPAPKPERWLYAGVFVELEMWFYTHPKSGHKHGIFSPVVGFGGVEYAELLGKWYMIPSLIAGDGRVWMAPEEKICCQPMTPRRVRIQNPEWRE